jgi:5-methylthioadenosine/S-adenosylhomocysteine deaminase
MKLYLTLAAVCHPDESPPSAADALRAATLNEAKTADFSDLGHLRAGMRAVVTILDLSDISYVTLNSVARQVVFTESGRAVETVIVDGRVTKQDRRILTVGGGARDRGARDPWSAKEPLRGTGADRSDRR